MRWCLRPGIKRWRIDDDTIAPQPRLVYTILLRRTLQVTAFEGRLLLQAASSIYTKKNAFYQDTTTRRANHASHTIIAMQQTRNAPPPPVFQPTTAIFPTPYSNLSVLVLPNNFFPTASAFCFLFIPSPSSP